MLLGTLGLGDPVPAFTLPDTEGAEHAVPADDAPAATVLVVTCNHCPYVIAWNPRLRAVAEDYADRGVRFLAINPNDSTRYPADSLERMRQLRRTSRTGRSRTCTTRRRTSPARSAPSAPRTCSCSTATSGSPTAARRTATTRIRRATPSGCAPRSTRSSPAEPLARAETPPKGCSVKWREP